LVKAWPRLSSSLILLNVLSVILEEQNSGGMQGNIMGMREHPSGFRQVGGSSKLTGRGQGQRTKISKNEVNKALILAFGRLRQTYAARIAR
jgi:hypothetical protein